MNTAGVGLGAVVIGAGRNGVLESVPGDDDTALSCSESGVLAPLVGVLGSLQAMEAVKVLSGYGEPLVGRLQVFDLARGDVRELRLGRRPDCPVCSIGD